MSTREFVFKSAFLIAGMVLTLAAMKIYWSHLGAVNTEARAVSEQIQVPRQGTATRIDFEDGTRCVTWRYGRRGVGGLSCDFTD